MAPDTAASTLAALRLQRDRFVGFAFAAADLLLQVSGEGVITFAVGAAQTLLGCGVDEIVGRRFDELLQPADRAIAASLLGSLARGERFQPVTLGLARDGQPPVVFGGCRLGNRPNAFFLSLAISPATAPLDAHKTILPRADFAERAAQHMIAGGRSDAKLTLVAIDELGALEERLGEEVGGGLVSTIERYLYASAASVEAAGQLGTGRYGVIHKSEIDADRLQSGVQSLTRAVDPEGKGVTLRTSTLALDESGMEGSDAARALVYCINQFADSDKGELSIPSLRDGLDKVMAETVARVGNLRVTVADRDFTLVYQPIVHLGSRQVHHVEALARFRDGGSPGDTVAFAEAVRLIADFDLGVCQKVAAVVRQQIGEAVPVAVNISGRSLESAFFTNALMALLRPDLAPGLLIEITESAVVTHMGEVNARIQALRKAGFRVCLDDFGAGANTFHYLRSFEVDFVKIDGSLVKAALQNPRDGKLLGAVAGFCRETGIATIGEMIEDEPAAIGLLNFGIDYAQGYHFGKPVADLNHIKLPSAPPEKAEVRHNVKRKGPVATYGVA
jgi:EAL domain-containing protein (putative c-di-GMP-specific phosphodiesterase class I)